MRRITEIIIHCAATPNGKEFHATDIDRWHRERGWQMIGYHYVICVDGSLERGRDIIQVGAHAEGRNANSIGICMIGTDKFTKSQWQTLKRQVEALKRDYPTAAVIGHRDTGAKKACPGFDVASWWADGGVPDERNIL